MILEKTLKDKIFNSLTSQQQEFLQQQVKRGKKTVFANILAKDKGIIYRIQLQAKKLKFYWMSGS